MKQSRAILLILALAFLQTACVVIEDGEVGVSKSFGAISDEPVPQGVAFVVPVARQIETWNIKLQELKESAQAPSSEGLIVGLDTSLLFQVTRKDAKTTEPNFLPRSMRPASPASSALWATVTTFLRPSCWPTLLSSLQHGLRPLDAPVSSRRPPAVQ